MASCNPEILEREPYRPPTSACRNPCLTPRTIHLPTLSFAIPTNHGIPSLKINNPPKTIANCTVEGRLTIPPRQRRPHSPCPSATMSTKTFRPLALLRPTARFYSSQPTPSPALLTRSPASTKPPTATPSPTSILASLFAPEQPSAPSPTGHTNYGFEAAEDVVKHQHRADMYLRKHPRRWREGDVYAPHDLSPAEAKKWKVVKSPKRDVIDMLGVNPLDNYRVGLAVRFPCSKMKVGCISGAGRNDGNHGKKDIRRI